MRGVLLLVCAVSHVAYAAPTGLNQIPTTDLVPFEQATIQMQNGTTEVSGKASLIHHPALVGQSEFGLPWRLEVGLDVAPADPPHDYRPALNLKWSPIVESYRVPGVAAGITQVGGDLTPNYFLVLSKTINYGQIQYQKFRAHHRNIKLRGIRFHTGILRTANEWRALVGTDVEVNDHFVAYADWISGASNAVSLGGVVILTRQSSIQVALLRGNDQDRVSGVLVALTHTFDFAHPLDW